MPRELNTKETTRSTAYELWSKDPNPMVVVLKSLDVTNLVKISKKKGLKFNMLLSYCIGKAAEQIEEFYILPVGDKLMQYDTLAINTVVENINGGVNSCDIAYCSDLDLFNQDYLMYTSQVAETCQDRNLSADSMVIGTTAIIGKEIDGSVGKSNGNNPFLVWSEYNNRSFPYYSQSTLSLVWSVLFGGFYNRFFPHYYLLLDFHFHHAQMDEIHAGKFLFDLQKEANSLKWH